MRRRFITLVVVALAAPSLLLGCGQSDEEKFKQDFKSVDDKVLALGQDVARAVRTASGRTDAELASEFGDFARRAGDLRNQLADLDAPAKLRGRQHELVAALGALRADLAAIQAAAGRHDAAGARAATDALIRDSARERFSREALARATGAKLR